MKREVLTPRPVADHRDHLGMALTCALAIIVLCVVALLQGLFCPDGDEPAIATPTMETSS